MDILRRSLQSRPEKIMKVEGGFIDRAEDEASLGSTEDAGQNMQTTLLDTTIDVANAEDVQFKFMDDNVTFRVVQFGDNVDPLTSGTISTGSTLSGSPTGGSSPQDATIYTGPLNGVYVINSNDVFPVNDSTKARVIQTTNPTKPTPHSRDDRRRATHNEVERRRRDKISNWIMKLGKIIPECKSDSPKGSYEMHSKGGILAKACDYIVELRDTNERLLVFVKENEQLLSDVQSLGRQNEDLRRENETLRNLLSEHGIQLPL